MENSKKETRGALLIRCTEEEAAIIRGAARRERRTVSAFVIHATMNRIAVQQRTLAALESKVKAEPQSNERTT